MNTQLEAIDKNSLIQYFSLVSKQDKTKKIGKKVVFLNTINEIKNKVYRISE